MRGITKPAVKTSNSFLNLKAGVVAQNSTGAPKNSQVATDPLRGPAQTSGGTLGEWWKPTHITALIALLLIVAICIPIPQIIELWP